jgi:large repetitive protein
MACIVDLFGSLGGTPDTGGNWFYVSAPTINFAAGSCPTPGANADYDQFDPVGSGEDICVDLTGVAPGSYVFRYVVPGDAGPEDCSEGCTGCAEITIVVAESPEDGAPVEYCENVMDCINLYDLLGNTPSTDGNWACTSGCGGGDWGEGYSADNNGANDCFKPSELGEGSYTFTYTVNSDADCDNCSATVEVTINPAEDAGIDNPIQVCG